MKDWISVEDRLPEKQACYLCWVENQSIKISDGYDLKINDGYNLIIWDNGFEPECGIVTHWLDLNPPEGK